MGKREGDQAKRLESRKDVDHRFEEVELGDG